MEGAWSLLAIAGTVALCVTFIILVAEGDNGRERSRTGREQGANVRDWRETWCCPECYAAHDQAEPCEDCPARRAERRDQSRF